MSNFADTSAARIAVAKEAAYGVNPGVGAVYARFTSDSLQQNEDTKVSAEVTGDRNPRGLILTNINAQGDINFEFSDNNFDTLFEGALTSVFSTSLVVQGASINIGSASGGTFTLTAASGTPFANVVVGQWIRLDGFAVNGTIYCRVTVKTSSAVVTGTGTRQDGVAVTNESGNTDIDIDGSQLKLGNTKTSFTIEREWTDIGVYELFTGMNVATASLSIAPGDIIKGKFGFLGSKQQDFTTTQIGSKAAAGNESFINAIDGVEAVLEGDFATESTLCFTELSFDIDNKLRAQNCIGGLGASGIGLGVAEVKGTIKAFLEDKTLIDKFLNFTASALAFRLKDADGNVMIFTFPKIHFSSGQDVISGNAADGIVELAWTGEKEDGVSNSAITIDRFPATGAC